MLPVLIIGQGKEKNWNGKKTDKEARGDETFNVGKIRIEQSRQGFNERKSMKEHERAWACRWPRRKFKFKQGENIMLQACNSHYQQRIDGMELQSPSNPRSLYTRQTNYCQ